MIKKKLFVIITRDWKYWALPLAVRCIQDHVPFQPRKVSIQILCFYFIIWVDYVEVKR